MGKSGAERDEGEHGEGGEVTYLHYGVLLGLLAVAALLMAWLRATDAVAIPWSVVSLPVWGPPVALVVYVVGLGTLDMLRDPRTWARRQ